MNCKNATKGLLLSARHFLHGTTGVKGTCRFEPTCSVYATEAIENHGVFKGLWLATKRLLKCHPWGKGGLDLVPVLPRNQEKLNGC